MMIEHRIEPKADLANGIITIDEFTKNPLIDLDFDRDPTRVLLERHARQVVDTRDKVIRDALIKLGWTPPAVALPDRKKAGFDGSVYSSKRDKDRLDKQLDAIYELMRDGVWRTLSQISDATSAPHASVSAQLRNLRKERFGAFTVNKRHLGGGLYEYQLSLV